MVAYTKTWVGGKGKTRFKNILPKRIQSSRYLKGSGVRVIRIRSSAFGRVHF